VSERQYLTKTAGVFNIKNKTMWIICIGFCVSEWGVSSFGQLLYVLRSPPLGEKEARIPEQRGLWVADEGE